MQVKQERVDLLAEACNAMEGNAALGRALGYRDGAYVGQMLRGTRPISDETLIALADLHALRHLRPKIVALLPHPIKPIAPGPSKLSPQRTPRSKSRQRSRRLCRLCSMPSRKPTT